jgi:hypothetical protein
MSKTKIYAKDNSYNLDTYLRESHNCYSYFLNLKSKDAYDLCKKNFHKDILLKHNDIISSIYTINMSEYFIDKLMSCLYF